MTLVRLISVRSHLSLMVPHIDPVKSWPKTNMDAMYPAYTPAWSLVFTMPKSYTMYPTKGYNMVKQIHSLRNTNARGTIQRQAGISAGQPPLSCRTIINN